MRIRERMEARGLMGYQVAEALNVAPSAVSRWVSGKGVPRTDKLPQLARLLHCTIDELFDGEPPGGEVSA